MEHNKLTIDISTAAIFKVAGILLFLFFAYFIRDILLMIFIAIIFAALIEPAVNFLENKKIPRVLSAIGIYLALFLLLALVIRMIIPPIAEQVALLINNFPELWNKGAANFSAWQQYSQEQGLVNNVQQGLTGLQAGLQKAASGVYSFVLAVFSDLMNFVVILVITFYLVLQKDAIPKMFIAVAPEKHHPYLIDLISRIQSKIGDWVRGQLILCLIIGSLSFIGLIFLLPKYALMLAIFAGLMEIIPYLGPTISAIPAVFLALMGPPISLTRALAVLILCVVIQLAENNLIVPQVMKKQVGLNPVVVIVIMLIGAQIAGIIGIFLAIPVALVIGIIAKDFSLKSETAK
ncbi:MAG: hypothetical protein A3J65_02235 [Candidatus Buchananbacteria bacterium RIFCSPHIGHO2_02_FULL_45_11b]|uniref:AI-2E family transporter n=3 Tax=Candidatus Buchananiibacteriota TaxID=1817903 RepID=A0A1G1Y8B5_9BACT|nr:MAG: hypothetical protein A2663_02170 [Candidatus Buchananbacteria bacterium RIFCSPHIGHO2_01_FULL_46_12]OGY49976.1 MAG: hypothetical protein A3J65_02235 [Candidatus Buchananbacteria bacterium RIFCSPHIGHO2_02_FULL_45_11b]OGY54127.1 MAG: hypothetical protein A3B15_03315 [Candidatus Buchananbacteria bacterium RIFCSPLOWO2_01_FULL_45_31]